MSALDQENKSVEDVADAEKTGESRLSRDKSGVKSKEMERSVNEANKSAMSSAASVLSLAVLPERDNIDNDFKPVIIELWRDLAKNYKGQMRRIFRNIRLSREQANARNFGLKMQFLEFLHTADGKQDILDEFVKNFNEFSD